MIKKLRIVMAQLDFRVGDIAGNLQKHIAAASEARDKLAADIIIFPELSITGYPPEDLLLRKDFLEKAQEAVSQLKDTVKNIHCLVGHPQQTAHGVQNVCSIIYNQRILGRYAKQYLPDYGVFDECRYFTPGQGPCIFTINTISIGVVICEDIWHTTPMQQATDQGARLILCPNASPFEIDKHEVRTSILSQRAKQFRTPIAYTNLIGGQDELVFDGGSMVVDEQGQIAQAAAFFQETLYPVDFEITHTQTRIEHFPLLLPAFEKRIYEALKLGLRDYIEKNHLPGVIVGLSGGIDSALTATIAADALGKDRVHGVLLPSRYTADMSIEDATLLSKQLGIRHDLISIESAFSAFLNAVDPLFPNRAPSVMEENIQTRCRAVILMAISNKTGFLLLTTGNRSEIAVGYDTLYGDMAGGFSVLKDVFKTQVYQLARYRNALQPVIPLRILHRPPSAELAPNQKDEDTLPPYSVLDRILELYMNQGLSVEEIVVHGFERGLVERVVKLIHKNEYKRRQAAPGVRINNKAFGRDWRFPLTKG